MSQISTKLLVRFSNDFAHLLESEYDHNVIVKVGQQSFKLHSLVLYLRSSFFRQELATATKKNNIIEITLTDTSVEVFKILINLNLASWLKLKFAKVYSTSFQDNNFKALQIFCTNILAKHPDIILASDEFTSIQENALINLLFTN
ncbi:hypothetical protein C2G38_2194086 [Gigaspora rosea]|uniref:BTB domain-containing protein n=1 Tax=Gigaspora rosea TaxID=44941 RepID=A0A397UX13_9GLOM|nr:hypothetical protein C2G38_2194086 [Gigaspora rosea]